MSLLWPDRHRVALRSDAVVVAAVLPFRRTAELRDIFVCGPQTGPVPWKGCLDTIAAEVAGTSRRAAVSVVLSNHFCQFALLEKPQAIASDAEAVAYAKNRMQALYGEAAKEWVLDLRPGGRNTWLVCCAQRGLIEAIRDVFAAKRTTVRSIQPYFAAAWQRRAGTLHGNSGWFVVHESKRLVAGRVSGGRWVHLAARRTGDSLDDVLDVLDRERELAGDGAERNVWLYGSAIAPARVEYRDYMVNVVAPPRDAQVEITKRPLYAMAA